jgi:hypothetical protein
VKLLKNSTATSNKFVLSLIHKFVYNFNECIYFSEKATKWLNEQAQKEGWTKAEKLKNRATSQGAIALYVDRVLSRATLVEVYKNVQFLLVFNSKLLILLE